MDISKYFSEVIMSDNVLNGYLIVKVSTASGAIPVENVTVVVSGIEEGQWFDSGYKAVVDGGSQ